MPNPTIKDIARKASVSTATVSYVLNNNRTVSDELRARVMNAIEELSYSPNAVARSLRRRQTGIVGIIGPSNSDPFYAEMVTGIEEMGYQAGYSILLCNTHYSLEREINYFQLLRMKQVDGVILLLDHNRIDWIQSYLDGKIPVVRYGQLPIPELDIDTVHVDNQLIGRIATQYLLDLGHSRIACITPPRRDQLGFLRYVGYQETLAASGYQVDSRLIVEGDYSIDGGYNAALALVDQHVPFTALFTSNDAAAIGAIHAFKQAHFRIPDDISVVSVDNIHVGSHIDPPLTSVSIPVYHAGETIFYQLHARMTGKFTGGPRDVIIECELVVRDSCRQISRP